MHKGNQCSIQFSSGSGAICATTIMSHCAEGHAPCAARFLRLRLRPQILDPLRGTADRRVEFIRESLVELDSP
jgi:hypothetical protein